MTTVEDQEIDLREPEATDTDGAPARRRPSRFRRAAMRPRRLLVGVAPVAAPSASWPGWS